MGNISRTPMRDALGRLEQEGLITILPKKGLMVSGHHRGGDVHSMFEMRLRWWSLTRCAPAAAASRGRSWRHFARVDA
ncbi:MAG: GntR family transcriptional regulator [Faecalibacterium prausnitzii]